MAGSTQGDFNNNPGTAVPFHQYQIDPVTNLPLLPCPSCGDVSMVAFTVKNPDSKIFGMRYFKCPRNRYKDKSSCQEYYLQENYDMLVRSAIPKETHYNEDHVNKGVLTEATNLACPAESELDLNCSPVLFEHRSPPSTIQQDSAGFWLKLMCLQIVVLNVLMALLILIVCFR